MRWNCRAETAGKSVRRAGRRPKHSMKDYLKLIILKEANRSSLRMAEACYSELVCGMRVDHSVIHYWEKRFGSGLIEELERHLGRRIEELLNYSFSVLDSTKMSTWRGDTVEFHLLVRIAGDKGSGTVYPAAVAFGSTSGTPLRAIVPGELMADAWYDSREVLRSMFKMGYTPIVKPAGNRERGMWRKKARVIFYKNEERYRMRGVGESVFGSLTNMFGDRLKTSLEVSTTAGIGAGITAYMVRIYMRIRLSYTEIRTGFLLLREFLDTLLISRNYLPGMKPDCSDGEFL